jgi:hypothetical protein
MAHADEIKSALDKFYRGYIDAFNREDLDHFLNCFAIPHAWVSGERGLVTITSEVDHQKGFSRIMADLKSRGWARSAIDHFHAWALADQLGMILADYTRYKTDGSILEQGRACYTVRRDGEAWKIVSLSEVKAPFLGPGDVPR